MLAHKQRRLSIESGGQEPEVPIDPEDPTAPRVVEIFNGGVVLFRLNNTIRQLVIPFTLFNATGNPKSISAGTISFVGRDFEEQGLVNLNNSFSLNSISSINNFPTNYALSDDGSCLVTIQNNNYIVNGNFISFGSLFPSPIQIIGCGSVCFSTLINRFNSFNSVNSSSPIACSFSSSSNSVISPNINLIQNRVNDYLRVDGIPDLWSIRPFGMSFPNGFKLDRVGFNECMTPSVRFIIDQNLNRFPFSINVSAPFPWWAYTFFTSDQLQTGVFNFDFSNIDIFLNFQQRFIDNNKFILTSLFFNQNFNNDCIIDNTDFPRPLDVNFIRPRDVFFTSRSNPNLGFTIITTSGNALPPQIYLSEDPNIPAIQPGQSVSTIRSGFIEGFDGAGTPYDPYVIFEPYLRIGRNFMGSFPHKGSRVFVYRQRTSLNSLQLSTFFLFNGSYYQSSGFFNGFQFYSYDGVIFQPDGNNFINVSVNDGLSFSNIQGSSIVNTNLQNFNSEKITFISQLSQQLINQSSVLL